MTNRIAIAIGIVVLAAVVADQVANGGEAALFLVRRFFGLIEYMAFWR